MKYLIGICSLLVLVITSGSAYADLNPREKNPINDSVAKADSILNLRYNPKTYAKSLKELARWDSCKARQIDSCVTALIGLAKSPDFLPPKMEIMTYREIFAYVWYLSKTEPLPYNWRDREPVMTEKPVIYLYPNREQNITVKLGLKGSLNFTWPEINADNTWKVRAQPDGTLFNEREEDYPYLFWDGVQDDMSYIKQDEGFLVKQSGLARFMREKLLILGINARERADFITYWVPRMTGSEYYFIRFETTAYSKAVPLTVIPKPESIQRVFMVFKRAAGNYKYTEQELTPFRRKGYTVIEWGGAELPSVSN